MGSRWRAALAAACGAFAVGAQEQSGQHAGRVLPLEIDAAPPPDVVVFDGRDAHVWFGTGAAPWFAPGPSTGMVATATLGAPVVAGGRLVVATTPDALDPRPRVVARGFDRAGRGAGAWIWRLGTAVGSNAPEVESLVMVASPQAPGTVLAIWTEVPPVPGIAAWVAHLVPDRLAAVAPLPIAPLPAARVVALHDAPAAATPTARLMLVLERRGAGAEVLRLTPISGPALQVAGGPRLPWFPPFSLGERDPLAADSVTGVLAPTPAFALPVLHPIDGMAAVLHASGGDPWLGATGALVPWPPQVRVRLLPDSAADYDGDGDEEIGARLRTADGREWLAVFDPHPLGASLAIAAVPGDPDPSHDRVAHAAPVDVDGDGRPELVVSWQPEPGVARLGVLGVRGAALVGWW